MRAEVFCGIAAAPEKDRINKQVEAPMVYPYRET